MKEPRRWLDDASGPKEARELLRHARPTRPIDKRALASSAALIAKVVATPGAAAAWPLAVKILVSASLLGTAGIIGVQLIVPAGLPSEAAPASHIRVGDKAARPHAAPAAARELEARGSVRAQNSAAVPTFTAPVPAELRAERADTGSAPAIPPPTPAQPVRAVVSRVSAAKISVREPLTEAGAAAAPATATASRIVLAQPEPDAKEAASGDQLLREVELLDSARALLTRDPRAALRTVETHAARFSRALLAAERELIAVEALFHLGRDEEARTRAAQFLRSFSGSMYRERVRALLAGPPQNK